MSCSFVVFAFHLPYTQLWICDLPVDLFLHLSAGREVAFCPRGLLSGLQRIVYCKHDYPVDTVRFWLQIFINWKAILTITKLIQEFSDNSRRVGDVNAPVGVVTQFSSQYSWLFSQSLV